MKTVYLAGPITGMDRGEANDWRYYISKNLGDNIVAISPLRGEPLPPETYKISYNHTMGKPMAINGKNWFDTHNCDIILAYLPSGSRSVGTLIELGWAIGMRKPIVLVCDNNEMADHPLIACNINWIVDSFDDAIEVVNILLGDYAI